MKILDKYTLKQIIIGFILVLTSMTVLVWLTQSLRMIDMIVTKGVSAGLFLKLTVLVLPNFLQILSPLALFAVSLFTLLRMQADKELMVMQAVGMNTRQIMRPIFGLAVVLAIIGYALSLSVIPAANTSMREMRWRIKNDLSHLLLQEGQFNSFDNGLTLYVKERLPDGQIRGVLAYDRKKPDRVAVLSAKSGAVYQETDGIRVVFYDGTRQEYQPATHQFSILKFEKHTMMFSDKNEKGTRSADVRELSLRQLWQATPDDTKGSMPLWRKHKVELVKRLIQPLYNLSFLCLVIFGVLSGYYNRRGQAGRVYAAVGGALIVQSLALAFENMAGKNLWFLILVVLNVAAPALFLYTGWAGLWRRVRTKLPVAAVILICAGSAEAVGIKMVKTDTQAPVDFEADAVSYNQKTNELAARGNVVLKQDAMTVKTDRILYNRGTNKITAPDPLTIEMSDGTTMKTTHGELAGDLSALDTGKTDVYLYEGSYMGAERMERFADGDSHLTEAVYTPCDRCEGSAPLWQLRAVSVHHDQAAKDLIYKHAFLDVKNVPVAYVPYWRMPDFTVKRRTGFLPPGLFSTHEMRKGISLPFFVDVADNQNLLLTPIVSPEHFPLGLVDYQGVFSAGRIDVHASGTRDRDQERKQGHIRASFEYDVNDKWRLGGEWFRVSSDTYFRRYRIPGVDDTQSFLTSHLTAERFGNRNYFRLKNYGFQSLQYGVNSDTIPVILPVLDWQYNTAPVAGLGLYGFSAVNAALYHTRERFKSDRLSVTQGATLPYIGPGGVAIDFTGFVRADGYSIDTGRNLMVGRPADETYHTGRIYPNVSATLHYPFVRTDVGSTQILEPVVMLVAAPNGGNSDKIPNVDSLVFDFDDTNLFEANRFTGYDRVEPGSRVNYGVKWSWFNHLSGHSVSALFGQSYRFDDDELMTGLMGYAPHFSNYVGRFQFNTKYFSVLYRARLDQKTLQTRKSELGVSGGVAPLRGGIDYVLRKTYKIGNATYHEREEIKFWAASQLSKNWRISGDYRYDLSDKGRPVSSGATLQYDNECTAVIFDVSKSFTKDRDYKGSTSFMIKVVLKTLGGM